MRTENWPNDSPASGCGCARCRDGRSIERLADASLSAALAHAQNRAESDGEFEAATPAGTLTLPGRFGGWRGAVTLDVLFGSNAPSDFTKPKRLLYRIYVEGRQKPLYIGMAYNSAIRDRVLSHLRAIITKSGALAKTASVGKLALTPKPAFGSQRSEIQKLRILAAQLGLGARIKVQYAEVKPSLGHTLDPKLLHAFESALQVLERPHSYVGSVRTFELEHEF